MRLTDLLQLSLKNFRNRKSRVILTVLGVAVAIGVIMFLISLGYGLQKTVLERITTEDSLLTVDVYPPDTQAISLTPESLETLEGLSDVQAVSPQTVLQGLVSFEQLSSDTTVNIVDENFVKLAGLRVTQGDGFSTEKRNEVVISPTVADLFGTTATELLGKELQLSFVPGSKTPESSDSFVTAATERIQDHFTVVGIIPQLESSNQLFIRYQDVPEFKPDTFQYIKVQVTGRDKIELVRSQIIEQGFLVSALSDMVEQANQIFTGIQIVLAVFGIFSLIVAAIGLINTMTISLLERINEIGIMRAIGASTWDIRKIFLLESTLIGLSGGVVGILFGYIGSGIFSFGLNILARALGGQSLSIFHTPLWFVLFVITFSGIVGLISGLVPARKAGNLNALEALRYK